MYLNPSLAASSRLFSELNRDTPPLERFVVASLGARHRRSPSAATTSPASSTNLTTTTGAIGRQQRALADALAPLPPFMRRANSTFVNLRATLDDLNAARRRVQAGRAEAAPLPRRAAPAGPGRAPDRARPHHAHPHAGRATTTSIELTQQHRRRCATSRVGPVKRNGKQRAGRAARLGQGARAGRARDRLRAALRARPDRLVRRLQPLGRLRRARRREPRGAARQRVRARPTACCTPIPPELREPGSSSQLARLGQRNRCPGAIERGAVVEADARLHLRPTRSAAGAHEARIGFLAALVVVAAAAPSCFAAAAPQRRTHKQPVLGRARQRLRPDPGRRPEDRRRARGQDHRHEARPADQPRADRHPRSPRRASATCAPTPLRGPPAVADRRVLPRLQARARRASACAAARRSRSAHRRRRSRPTSSTTSCAARSRERLSLILYELGAGLAGNAERPERRRSAAAARRCARPTRCWHPRQAEHGHPRPQPARRHGRRRPRRTTAATSALGRQGARHRRATRPTRHDRHRRRLAQAARPSSPSCARRWPPSATPPTSRRRRSTRSASNADQLKRFFDDLGPFADASRPALPRARRGEHDRLAGGQGGRADGAELNTFAKGAPELGKNLAIVLEHLDDRKQRRRVRQARGRAAGRQGAQRLQRPGGAAAVRARPGHVDQHLRPEHPHPRGHGRRGRPVPTYKDYVDGQRQQGARDQCQAKTGPNSPGVDTPDVSAGDAPPRQVKFEDAPRRRPAATSRARRRRPSATRTDQAGAARRRTAPKTPDKPKTPDLPKTPDVPKPPPVQDPRSGSILPGPPAPKVPPAPKLPGAPPASHAAAGLRHVGQAAPDQLLDYLMGS